MYSIVIILLLCSRAFASDPENPANRFNTLVIFGDSFSDTGNDYQLTNYTYPISPPYYKGRFCDGPIWVDRLKVSTKLNNAFGGATTDSNFVQGYTKFNTVPVPGVRQQVAIYLKIIPKHIVNNNVSTLHIIWAGGNDFIFNKTVTPIQIVKSLMNSVRDLLVAGAKNILVINQPPDQAFPYTKKLNETAYVNAIANTGDDSIAANLAVLQKNYTNASILMFDVHALLTKVISNTSSTTFANTVDQCWDTYNLTTVVQLCRDPKKYVFIDNFHFTSPVQQLIADAIQPFLSYSFKDSCNCYFHSF